MSVNTPRHISLAHLLGVLRCERNFQKGRTEEGERQLRERLAKVPGMPALRKLLEWSQETPTLEEALKLKAELNEELAIMIRDMEAREWAGKPPEEMPLPEIAGVIDQLQGYRLLTSPEGQALLKKTAYRFNHLEEYYTDKELLRLYQGFVAKTIADLDKPQQILPAEAPESQDRNGHESLKPAIEEGAPHVGECLQTALDAGAAQKRQEQGPPSATSRAGTGSGTESGAPRPSETNAEKAFPWEFFPGGFRFLGKAHNGLSGLPHRLLSAFAHASEQILTHEQVKDAVWGEDYSPADSRVRGLVSELRSYLKKEMSLEENPIVSIDRAAWKLKL